MRSSIGLLLMLLAAAGCIPSAPGKKDAGPPVCCRTNPDAGPESCVCEAAAKNIIMIDGTTCSLSTTVNGQAVAFTGIIIASCPSAPEPPVCCRTNPDAGPEGCVCEPAEAEIVMVDGGTCSLSTTVNGQAVAFTGINVSSCP